MEEDKVEARLKMGRAGRGVLFLGCTWRAHLPLRLCTSRSAAKFIKSQDVTKQPAGYHLPALRIVEPGPKMSTQDPMLLKEEIVSWFVLDATPMLLGLEAGLWLQQQERNVG